MKKILFISNISNRITNFSLPSIYAAQNLGYEFHMAANYSNFKDNPGRYGVKLHHIDLDRNPLSKQNITAYKQMLDLIEKEKFDTIHCNTPIGGVLGRLCGKKACVPKVIYTAHGFHFYKGASLINRTLFKWTEMWMARYTDVIITINQEDYQAAQKFNLRNNGNIYYVPGVGVDTSAIKNMNGKRNELLNEINAKEDSTIIISVGELNENKNNKVVIEALGKIKNLSFHYVLCGVGEKEEELIKLSQKLGLKGNIHFLGYRVDIPQLLKSSDIFVLPSYREGLSRSLMEAMSAGLPCIVSEIRGNVDLIKDEAGGYLRNPDDVEGLAEAINIISTDKRLREKMSTRNLEEIKKFDIMNVKKVMKKIYERELI